MVTRCSHSALTGEELARGTLRRGIEPGTFDFTVGRTSTLDTRIVTDRAWLNEDDVFFLFSRKRKDDEDKKRRHEEDKQKRREMEEEKRRRQEDDKRLTYDEIEEKLRLKQRDEEERSRQWKSEENDRLRKRMGEVSQRRIFKISFGGYFIVWSLMLWQRPHIRFSYVFYGHGCFFLTKGGQRGPK